MPRVDTISTLSQKIYQSLPLYVKCVVDSKIDLAYFASANGINVKKCGDLNNLVNAIKAHNIPVEPFRVTGMELSMPCIRKTDNTDATVPAQLEFVNLVKPAFVVVQMKTATFHTHSNDLHKTTAKDLFGIGYYTNITERLSSSCGDVTGIGRWILFGHIFHGLSFDMMAYSDSSAFDQLLSFARYDSSAIPLHVRKIGGFMCTETWRTGQVVQRSDENDDHGSMFVGNPTVWNGLGPSCMGECALATSFFAS